MLKRADLDTPRHSMHLVWMFNFAVFKLGCICLCFGREGMGMFIYSLLTGLLK